MRTLVVIATLATLTTAPGAATADTLTVTSSSPTVTAERFEYRRVSTRVWYPWVGCWTYDVLQGSGWFPTTWYHDEAFDADGSVELSRNWVENYCAAEMDEINGAWFTYTDPQLPGRVLRGNFRVVPGAGTSDAVTCRVTDTANTYRNFECTDATAAIDERDVAVRIDIAR